jgi:hypothetical protein
MTAISPTDVASTQPDSPRPKLDHAIGIRTILLFLAIVAFGLFFAAYNIYRDISAAGTPVTGLLPCLLLGVALLIALGFEFVNGFHDTANAVATVIYTHSLPAPVAVVWSGFFNLLGVLLSTGAVAFGIVSLLAVELNSSGRLRGRIRDGLRDADRRDHLESRHLVAGSPGIKLSHLNRLNHRRRHCQFAHAGAWRDFRRRLEQGDRDWLRAFVFSACWVHLRGGPSRAYEVIDPQDGTLYGAKRWIRSSMVDSRASRFHLGGSVLRAWFE